MASDILDGSASPDMPLPEPEGPGLFGDAPAAAPPAAPTPASEPAPGSPYRVLARKYRPATFADLIGQEAMVRTLRNAFARNRVHHAFMLTGVRGVGKTTTARIIARALNCTGPDGQGGPAPDPCGVCPDCRAILADRHPDYVELDAASNRGIEDIRELREGVRFRPAQARFKVYMLDEVHMLTEPAFNALLKTLEEPPPQVKFLLATTELRKVPATILSRCQTFHLKRVPQETLRMHFARICGLEGVAAEEEALAMVARAADGSVRDGLSILDQAIALGAGTAVEAASVRDMLGLADRDLALSLMEAVMGGDVAAALATMEGAHERGVDPGVVLSDMLELTHRLTRFRTVAETRRDPALPEAERVRGVALAERLSVPVLGRAWQMLLKGLQEVAQEGVDRRAAAEMVLIRLAHVAELPTPGDLVRRLTEGGASGMAASPVPSPNGGGFRAVAGGGALAVAAPAPAGVPAAMGYRDIVALAHGRRPMLHAHLVHSVHPVRIAPGRIEIRTRPEAPRDLAQQLGALMLEETGSRWTVTLTNEAGEPTLAEQARGAEAERRVLAESHPLVQAVLAAFPGARIEEVRDASLDAYGLPVRAPQDDFADAEMHDIAPPDAAAGFDEDPTPEE